MRARRRLFVLLVALVCAMGWMPTASARASLEGVAAGQSLGVVPGQLPPAPPADPSTAGHDPEPAALPPAALVTPEPASRLVAAPRCAAVHGRGAPRYGPASPRGPPAIA